MWSSHTVIRRQILEQSGSPECSEAVNQFHEFLGDDVDVLKDAAVGNVVLRGGSAHAEVTGAVDDSVQVELQQVAGEWCIATFGFAN